MPPKDKKMPPKNKKMTKKEKQDKERAERKVALQGGPPAKDDKKLRKMVEELANKYSKTEDEIYYNYDK
jgi:hypothetical protein